MTKENKVNDHHNEEVIDESTHINHTEESDSTMGNKAKKSGEKNKTAKDSKQKYSKEEQAELKIDELEENLAELNDKYLRLFSEFDNYRKRTNKERLDLMNTASAQIIIDLLPVLDDFDRALVAMESGSASDQSYVEGTKLIFNKLKGILEKRGLESMKSIGETFDTDFHEALTNIPAPTPDLKGKVVDEIEKGYMLKGKVIRYAKVVVGQ